MTVTTDSRERQRMIAQRWALNPDADVDEIANVVDVELAETASERAEQEAKTKELTDSITRMMFTCNSCGRSKEHTATDGLCVACRRLVLVLTAERDAEEIVDNDGHTRREYVEAYLARQSKGRS